MANYEINFDYDYYEKNCNYDDLKLAIEKLTNASEKDFESIKNEKWYNRLFDMITLSKKKDIRIANQIGNLAQAQQLMIEILNKLSERDIKITGLIIESFDKIEKLSQQDLILARKLKNLEAKCIYGVENELDITQLNDIERKILAGCMIEVKEKIDIISEEQKKYANTILSYLEVSSDKMDINNAIENIDSIEVKKIILRCVLEYGFLNSMNFSFISAIEDIIEKFDFGNKTINTLINKIQTIYDLRGAEGILDRYNIELIEDEETFIDIDFEIPKEDIKLEEMFIENILNIPIGKSITIENKILHIKNYINCDGKLIFKNCIINYNETEHPDEISLSEGAELEFDNCVINCVKNDKNYFIQGDRKNKINIMNCEFINCSYLFDINNSEINIEKCKIQNPSINFLNGFGVTGKLVNSTIDYDKDKIEKITKNIDGYDYVIYLKGYNTEFYVKESIIKNVIFEKIGKHITLFSIDNGQYINCEFSDCINIISKPKKIIQSVFKNCKGIVDFGFLSTDKMSLIEDNNFIRCTNIFNNIANTSIKYCQFVDCYNNILKSTFSGDVNLEFCEFINIKSDNSNDILAFKRSKNGCLSNFKKCIFDGIDLDRGFLISTDVLEKKGTRVLEINECFFQNCKTNRKSGKIIKEYSTYYGLFGKCHEVRSTYIYNCRGLDKVNKENNATDFVIRSKTHKGLKIGIGLIGIMTGPSGIVSAMSTNKVIDKFFTDDDIHEE